MHCIPTLAVVLAAASASAAHGFHAASPVLNASVVDGVLYVSGQAPTQVGSTTSALNGVITSLFAPLSPLPATSAVLINSSSGLLSYLSLSGTYSADVSLQLVRQLVLVLNGTSITAAASFTGASIVLANNSAYSAVVSPSGPSGGIISCPAGGPSPSGVVAENSDGFMLDGITIDGCGIDACSSGVHVYGKPYAVGGTISGNVINNSCRCIWTETMSHAVIQGNSVNLCSAHSIDFDAYSASSVAFNNTATNNAEEGIFIEQGATYITVVGNTLGPNNSVGIAVYNNDIDSVTRGHVIIGNRLVGNRRSGISIGSTAPKTGNMSSDILVVGNFVSGNGIDGMRANGGQSDVVYTANADMDGVSQSTLNTYVNGAVIMFDPLDRVLVSQNGTR